MSSDPDVADQGDVHYASVQFAPASRQEGALSRPTAEQPQVRMPQEETVYAVVKVSGPTATTSQ